MGFSLTRNHSGEHHGGARAFGSLRFLFCPAPDQSFRLILLFNVFLFTSDFESGLCLSLSALKALPRNVGGFSKRTRTNPRSVMNRIVHWNTYLNVRRLFPRRRCGEHGGLLIGSTRPHRNQETGEIVMLMSEIFAMQRQVRLRECICV
jgi:hypothetical protein